MKILFESIIRKQRKIERPGILADYNIPTGSYVSIAAITDDDITFGPRTQKYITADNDKELGEYIQSMPDGHLKDSLLKFRESQRYEDAYTGKRKTAPLNIEGDCHIFKVSRHIFNYSNPNDLANFYQRNNDAERKLRYDNGFGYDETSYDEDDWRQNYGGTGIYPRINNNRKGSAFVSYDNTGYYQNDNKPDELAIRQIRNQRSSKDPIWFFVDDKGNTQQMDKNLMNFLMTAYRMPGKEIVKEINAEEAEFVKGLKEIEKARKSEITIILDKMLYLTATAVNKLENGDTEMEPIVWINDINILRKFPYIQKSDLEKIIAKLVQLSGDEILELNRNINVYGQSLVK